MDLIDKYHLISDYGLRSLSPNSSFYQARNTPDDPPYWRGAIWPHMNYMFLRSFYQYINEPYSLSKDLKVRLKETGFLFEQYDDQTGEGKFGKPFTGWTSLVSLIVNERYHRE
ncbi:hypothetical protein ACOME3_003726 [Neoechinorhynchus agilis]